MGGTAGESGSSIAGEAGEAAEGETDLRSGAGERDGEEDDEEDESEKGGEGEKKAKLVYKQGGKARLPFFKCFLPF